MLNGKYRIRTRSVALAMSLLTLTASASSLACGGDWYPEVQVDPRIHGMQQAETSLQKGDYVAAAGAVIRMMPHIARLKPSADPLVARGQRVLSVAIARANGTLALEREVPTEVLGHWQGKNALDRQKNLAWSVGALRTELDQKKDDPALTTELGEALSRVEGGSSEARALLESLAQRDLVASAEGYRVLAQLRLEQGDQKGRELAMKRCESMAGSSKVCATDAPRAS